MKARCLHYNAAGTRTTNFVGLGRGYSELEKITTITESTKDSYLFHLRGSTYDFVVLEHSDETRVMDLVGDLVNIVESSNSPYRGDKPVVSVVITSNRTEQANMYLVKLLQNTYGTTNLRFLNGKRINDEIDVGLTGS